jgi:hypothetical protein
MTPRWQRGAEWWDDIAHDAFVCGELKGPAVQKLGSRCKSAVSRRARRARSASGRLGAATSDVTGRS